MNLAYLIRAHQNPAQLRRLVQALSHPQVRFFIHIDQKVDETPFRTALQPEIDRGTVHFIADRTELNWGGFSMIRATLKSLREMLAVCGEAPPDYVVLMSGQDYPLKSNDAILDFLERNRGKSFLSYAKIPPPFWGDEHRGRVEQFNFYDCKLLTWPANRGGRIGNRRTARMVAAAKLSRWLLPRRRPPQGLTLYAGSAWWCLDLECIRYVLDRVERDPAISRFFRWTLHSEEMFYQTVLMNSPLADRLVGEYHEPRIGDYLWFQIWAGAARPKTLTAEDADLALASDRLFARKFDPTVDEAIFDIIDRARGGQGGPANGSSRMTLPRQEGLN